MFLGCNPFRCFPMQSRVPTLLTCKPPLSSSPSSTRASTPSPLAKRSIGSITRGSLKRSDAYSNPEERSRFSDTRMSSSRATRRQRTSSTTTPTMSSGRIGVCMGSGERGCVRNILAWFNSKMAEFYAQ